MLKGIRMALDDEIDLQVEIVSAGNARDMEEYVRRTTRIRTLQDVMQMVKDIEKRFLDE